MKTCCAFCWLVLLLPVGGWAQTGRAAGKPLVFNYDRRFQTRYVDSVVRATHLALTQAEARPRTGPTDTLRLDLLLHLSYAYRYAPLRKDSVLILSEELVRLASRYNNRRYQVRGLLQQDYYYFSMEQNFPQALEVNYRLDRLLDTDPTLADQYRWRVQRNLGKISSSTGKHDEAIAYYRAASASICRDQQAAALVESMNLYQLMSESFKLINQLDSAERYSARALELAYAHHPTTTALAYLHGDMAIIFLHQNRYPLALAQLQIAERLWLKLNGRNGLAVTWADMAHVYYLTHRYDEALAYCRKALTYDTGIPSTRLLLYETLALGSAARQEWQPAFGFHKQFKALADSIQQRRRVAETMTLQARHDREKLVLSQQEANFRQQQQYLVLTQENEVQRLRYAALASQQTLERLRAINQRQRLLEAARQTDFQRTLEKQTLLAQAKSRQNQQQDQIRSLQVSDLRTKLTLQERTRNFWLLLAALAGVSMLIYNQLLRRKNTALRLANAEIKAALHHGHTQEMAALRAQMNPHFIFNCINSIKLYTLQNDTDRAATYLSKFARLIRLVLEYSRTEVVTLQNELEALRLYIELEAMRFKQKVRFSIEVAPNIDPQFVELPPLLLQPYVENAVWHGLMHKPEGGTVSIRVSQPDEQCLRVTITDDGVGRTQSAALKSKSAHTNKSFGMQLTAERLRILNQQQPTRPQVRIRDLVGPQNEPMGTEVTLDIPL